MLCKTFYVPCKGHSVLLQEVNSVFKSCKYKCVQVVGYGIAANSHFAFETDTFSLQAAFFFFNECTYFITYSAQNH